jgi:hypothetical protein
LEGLEVKFSHFMQSRSFFAGSGLSLTNGQFRRRNPSGRRELSHFASVWRHGFQTVASAG